MRIYISGKITGLEKSEYQKNFATVAEALRNRGHEVVNPSVHDFDLNYWGYMKLDLVLIDMCDAVLMLNNWQDSHGAKLEKAYAETKGKEVLYEDYAGI